MRNVVRGFVRVVDVVSTVFVWIGAVAVLYLTIAGLIDVVLRNTGLPILQGSYEYMEFALVCVAYFSMAYVQRQGGHVDTSMVTDKLSDRVSKVVQSVGVGITLVFLAWASWAATAQAIHSTMRGESKFGVFNFALWPARIVVAVGLILLTVQVAISLGKLIVDKTSSHDATPVHVGI